jgi:predicted lipoprotein with Yx(FWY)xxD motif
MGRTLRGSVACIAVLALVACQSMSAAPAPAKMSDGVLSNPAGMTLYTFDRDVAGSGKSACNGPCATNWPPFAASADAVASGEWSVITRDDGMKQWAYKGKPLYAFSKDQKPGDRTGDGFLSNAWHVAKT